MSYFTALVVRLGLYFWGLPLRKEGSHEKLYYSEKLGGSARGSLTFPSTISMLSYDQLNALVLQTQCFRAANSMLL